MKKSFLILIAGASLCLYAKDTFAASLPPTSVTEGLDAQAERFRQEYSVEKRARDQKITKALIETEEEEKAKEKARQQLVVERGRKKFSGMLGMPLNNNKIQ